MPAADRVTTGESSRKKLPKRVLGGPLDAGNYLYTRPAKVGDGSSSESTGDNVLDLPLGKELWQRSTMMLGCIENLTRADLPVLDRRQHDLLAVAKMRRNSTVFHNDSDLHASSIHAISSALLRLQHFLPQPGLYDRARPVKHNNPPAHVNCSCGASWRKRVVLSSVRISGKLSRRP